MATTQEINALYEELLSRPADATGLASFAGQSVDDVLNTLLSSPEYQINEQFQSELNRPLGDAGREFYLGSVQEGEYLPTLLQQIKESPEAQAIDDQYGMGDAVFVGNQAAPVDAVTIPSVMLEMLKQGTQLRQITPGSDFLPTNIPTGFFGADNNVAQLYNLGQTPTFRSGVGGYTDMLPSGFEFGIPAQFAEVPIYIRGLFDTGEDAEEVNNNPRRGTYAGGTVG